jgi:hypothetical protein
MLAKGDGGAYESFDFGVGHEESLGVRESVEGEST